MSGIQFALPDPGEHVPCTYCEGPSGIRIVGVPRPNDEGVPILPVRYVCGDCAIAVYDAVLHPKVQVTQ